MSAENGCVGNCNCPCHNPPSPYPQDYDARVMAISLAIKSFGALVNEDEDGMLMARAELIHEFLVEPHEHGSD